MSFLTKTALQALAICFAAVLLAVHFGWSFPHINQPHQTVTTTTNASVISEAFKSRVGLAAGQVEVTGLNAERSEQLWKIPPSLFGSCVTTKGGTGEITYQSDFTKYPPSVINNPDGTYIIQVPEPEPVQVGLTSFSDVKIKRSCGLLVNTASASDIQKLNGELLRQTCDIADQPKYSVSKQADVEQGVREIVRNVGIDPNAVTIQFIQSEKSPLKECA